MIAPNQSAQDAPADDWALRTEQALLDAAVDLAPDLGWGPLTVSRAAKVVGLSPAEVGLLLPNGAADLAALFIRRHDARALAKLSAVDPRALRMRDRIVRALEARLDAAAEDGEATRRCCGFLALPTRIPQGLRLAWDSSDVLWRWAGDTATDENHYSKRAILSGILIAAVPIRLSAGHDAAMGFIHARVDNVMNFETWKANLPKGDPAERLATSLGRARYGKAVKPPPAT